MDVIPYIVKSILKNDCMVICDRTGTPIRVERLGIYSRPGRPDRLVLLIEGKVYPLFNITTDVEGIPHLGILSVGAMLDAKDTTLEEACENYSDVFGSTITPINLEDYVIE